MYARCGEQFIDRDEIDAIIKQKERSDTFIGSLSNVKEVTTHETQKKNQTFIQWLKICERIGANEDIDRAREKYNSQIFQEKKLKKTKLNKYGKNI